MGGGTHVEARKLRVEWVLPALWVLEIECSCQACDSDFTLEPSLQSGRLFFIFTFIQGSPVTRFNEAFSA